MPEFTTSQIGNIRIHICQSEKFKTTAVMAFIQQSLHKDLVTKTSLLSHVLQRATASCQTTLAFKQRLDEMYGATLFGDVMKRGERHIMHLGMEFANEHYLRDKSPLLEKCINFFCEVLLQPLVESGSFKQSYVKSEIDNLRQKIESVSDDKIQYAAKRLTEVMCADESYSLFTYGELDDLSKINGKSLFNYYCEVIKTCPIDLYCVGNVDVDKVANLFAHAFKQFTEISRKKLQYVNVVHPVSKVKEYVEKMDVAQGKLNIGCRTNISVQDPLYPAMIIFNGIFGGFPHSKLFINVREKESLAYYVSSRIDSYKGLLLIQSGIEFDKYDQVVQIIKDQLTAMSTEDITEEELSLTKAMTVNQYLEQQDRAYDLITFHYHTVLSGRKMTIESIVQEFQEVNKEDLKKVADKLELDTIYFLRN